MNAFDLSHSIHFSNLVLFAISTVGMTFIIVDGDIFSWLRNLFHKFLPKHFAKVIDCYQCAGTWCGFFCGFVLVSHNPFVVFLCGCASSFLTVFVSKIYDYVESQTTYDLGEYESEDKA